MTDRFDVFSPANGPFEVELLYVDQSVRGEYGGELGYMEEVAKRIKAIYNKAAHTSGKVVATHEISFDYHDGDTRSLFFVIEHSDNNPGQETHLPAGEQPAIADSVAEPAWVSKRISVILTKMPI